MKQRRAAVFATRCVSLFSPGLTLRRWYSVRNDRCVCQSRDICQDVQQLATTVSGVADAAFYLPSTATLHFLKGRNAGVIQADFRMPHGMPRNLSQVQADSVVLAKAIAADL